MEGVDLRIDNGIKLRSSTVINQRTVVLNSFLVIEGRVGS